MRALQVLFQEFVEAQEVERTAAEQLARKLKQRADRRSLRRSKETESAEHTSAAEVRRGGGEEGSANRTKVGLREVSHVQLEAVAEAALFAEREELRPEHPLVLAARPTHLIHVKLIAAGLHLNARAYFRFALRCAGMRRNWSSNCPLCPSSFSECNSLLHLRA